LYARFINKKRKDVSAESMIFNQLDYNENAVWGLLLTSGYLKANPYKALLLGNCKEMNAYMNRIPLATFSYFDSGNRPSRAEPKRFYHGFVLGLIIELADKYNITSNRESGFGRYDVMLEPQKRRFCYNYGI